MMCERGKSEGLFREIIGNQHPKSFATESVIIVLKSKESDHFLWYRKWQIIYTISRTIMDLGA